MARPILDDDLWALIEPLLPPAQASALTPSRAQAAGQSRGTDGYPVYPPDWSALRTCSYRKWGVAAQRAAGAAFATGRQQECKTSSPSAACALACGRPNRLVPGHRRLLFNPCHGRRSKTPCVPGIQAAIRQATLSRYCNFANSVNNLSSIAPSYAHAFPLILWRT